MRKLLLTGFLLVATAYCYSQDAKHATRHVADIKGAMVRQEQGAFRNQKGQVEGSYTIVYIIDTIQKQLLNVSITSTDRRGEVIYLYYYDQNRLSKASSGVVQNGYTVIQSTYDYTEDDYALKEKELNAFSQTEEKYALLKEAQKYLAVLKKL